MIYSEGNVDNFRSRLSHREIKTSESEEYNKVQDTRSKYGILPPIRLNNGLAFHMARSINQSITTVFQLIFKLKHQSYLDQ